MANQQPSFFSAVGYTPKLFRFDGDFTADFVVQN
jgi:hypothetical protein